MMAHTSSCLFLTYIITCINPHIMAFLSHILIPVAQDNIFPVHITSPQYICDVFDSSALTDGSSGPSPYIIPTISGAAPRVFELGHCRRALHLCPEEQFGPQCAGPTTLLLNIALHPTCREQPVYTSNIRGHITFKDKYNPVRVKHQYIYIYLDCYITPPTPSSNVL